MTVSPASANVLRTPPATLAAYNEAVAPIEKLSQELAVCRKRPMDILGAIRRAKEIFAGWHQVIAHGIFPESERANIEQAMSDAQTVNTQMERLKNIMPPRDLKLHFGDRQLRLANGSIVEAKTDAIATAANAALAGGGGVDFVVHQAAGPQLLAACCAIGGCDTGDAALTPAFNLEPAGAKHVIHAVGPVWRGGNYNEEALLRGAYVASLTLADEHGCASLALPAISCGVYRFPLRAAAHIALSAAAEYLSNTQGPLREVVFVLYEEPVFNAFAEAVIAMAP